MGAILLPAGCCCLAAGVQCNCNPSCGVTPLRFRLTFSNVVLCPDCYNRYATGFAGPSIKWLTMPTIGVLDGAYLVTQTPALPGEACRFTYEGPANGVWQNYSGRDCTGELGITRTMARLEIKMNILCSTPPSMVISANYDTITGGRGSAYVFASGITETNHLCERGDSVVANNIRTCKWDIGISSGWLEAGSGGTCTVVPLI